MCLLSDRAREHDQCRLPDSRFDPAAAHDSAYLRAELRNALRNLSPEHQRAIALRYFGHMTLVEMARVMSCPEGTVKSRLHTALDRLRTQLEPNAGGAK